jgi:hypothetical protein
MSLELNKLANFWQPGREKTRGGKNEGNLHYVVENKCRKNARNRPFHYVIEK